jgi:hypothetical protein
MSTTTTGTILLAIPQTLRMGTSGTVRIGMNHTAIQTRQGRAQTRHIWNAANGLTSGSTGTCCPLPTGSSGARNRKFWSKAVRGTWSHPDESIHGTCTKGIHTTCIDYRKQARARNRPKTKYIRRSSVKSRYLIP